MKRNKSFKGIVLKKFISIFFVIVMIFFSCFINVDAYQEGETKLCTNNLKMEAYISKTTIRTMSSGVTIENIFIPKEKIMRLLGYFGFDIHNCPGGVILKFNNPVNGEINFRYMGIKWQ